MGLDKTAEGYQKDGVIKLLKYIRDGLAGGVIRQNNNELRHAVHIVKNKGILKELEKGFKEM